MNKAEGRNAPLLLSLEPEYNPFQIANELMLESTLAKAGGCPFAIATRMKERTVRSFGPGVLDRQFTEGLKLVRGDLVWLDQRGDKRSEEARLRLYKI